MFRKTRTLEQIASTFTQAIEDLKNLRNRNSDVIQTNTQTIQLLDARNLELGAENVKISRFQQNLETLVGE